MVWCVSLLFGAFVTLCLLLGCRLLVVFCLCCVVVELCFIYVWFDGVCVDMVFGFGCLCVFLVWCGGDFVVDWFGFGLVLRCFWLALAGVALWGDWFLARWFGV